MALKITLAGRLYTLHKMDLKYIIMSLYRTFLLVNLFLGPSVVAAHSWEKPGCYKVGKLDLVIILFFLIIKLLEYVY